MAVTKRLRYEILRRDNNTCRYCGGKSPDVTLTIDHVVPVSLGGSDDPSNLVAACKDCNAGKTSSNPDAPLVDTVSEDALRWAVAMRQAAAEIAEEDEKIERILDAVAEAWKPFYKPSDWSASVVTFIKAGLSEADLLAMVDVAYRKRGISSDRWSYFCGCCWSRLRQIQERAKEIVGSTSATAEPKVTTEWPLTEINSYVAASEVFASRTLTKDQIDSAHCLHKEWGEGDCGDVVCRIGRAESLSWMADEMCRREEREDRVMDHLDDLDELDEDEVANA
ncbi:HNH endonuclease [Mycobacterium phage Yoshi]|uniref:HNH endonuclease n=1 Tax=Mycobacterium phage Yoshi TaxID=2920891 RepID=G1BSJ4_9CAUD|nr:HNH endonuclease [Mycobacterium phage Yoshi]AEK07836.1 HNH endonuclease [Mycobacterium phage Yoshi]